MILHQLGGDALNSRGTGTVYIVNPLPRALKHYQLALVDVLVEGAGVRVQVLDSPTIEVGAKGGFWRRLGVIAASIMVRLRVFSIPCGHVIVLWPAFGKFEGLSWLLFRIRHRVSIIVHDPISLTRPMKRAHRLRRLAWRLGTFARNRIVHTRVAENDVGARCTVLPHPILDTRSIGQSNIDPAVVRDHRSEMSRRSTVVVLGQYKPARDVQILEGVASVGGQDDLRLLVKGSGWPPIQGWDVQDAFLSEMELVEALDSADCLLLPYSRFYQSGVAVRALEQRVPVVGPRHEQLEQLFGFGWPGLVDEWSPMTVRESIRAALAVTPEMMETRLQRARSSCVVAWRGFLLGSGRLDR